MSFEPQNKLNQVAMIFQPSSLFFSHFLGAYLGFFICVAANLCSYIEREREGEDFMLLRYVVIIDEQQEA